MNDILKEMQANGYELKSMPILDSKVHRIGKSQYYIGFQNHAIKGDGIFHVVVYGDWRTGEELKYMPNVKMSRDDQAAIKKQMIANKERAEREKVQLQEESAIDAQNRWENAKDGPRTDYQKRKNIPEMYGARVDGFDLVVPLRDKDGKIWSLQTIRDDGEKRFMGGGKVLGCFHQIGEFSDPIYIVEGYATAASVFQATGRGVACAFNSTNLHDVAREIKSLHPNRRILICGDNDLWTRKPDGTAWNPGRECGEAAAKSVLGKCVLPKFVDGDKKGTDYNDLHLQEGLDAVRAQISSVDVKRYGVYALGFFGDEYFFTSTENQQIVPIVAFTETQLLNLMPIEYWESAFPSKVKVDWSLAKSELMKQCRARGRFERRNIRGSGVWIDENRVVVNMGDHLLVDGERCGINEIKSKNFYTLGQKIPELREDPLTLNETGLLLEVCKAFKWKKHESPFLVAGLMVVNQVCGALPIRPHAWITGSSQTGKSTFLERVIKKSVEHFRHYFINGSSEAGLRQAVGADAKSVIFDEFETSGEANERNIDAIIELMRSAWSDTDGGIAKGTSGGTAMIFQPRFAAMVASIRVALKNDADKSRFVIFELAPHGNDKEHWRELDATLKRYNSEYTSRLFARTVSMVPVLLKNYEALWDVLMGTMGTREAQNYAMLLAGFGTLVSDVELTTVEIKELVEAIDEVRVADDDVTEDHDDCFRYLMTKKITLDTGLSRVEKTLEEFRDSNLLYEKNYQDAIMRYGIILAKDSIFVSTSSSETKALFRNQKWASSFGSDLRRVRGANAIYRPRIFGKQHFGVLIPLID